MLSPRSFGAVLQRLPRRAAGIQPLVSIRAPGCGPQALPALTLIEEVAELKERLICSALALQRLQLSASAICTFFSCVNEQ